MGSIFPMPTAKLSRPGWMLLVLASLSGCSYVSAFAAVQDLYGGSTAEGDRTREACARARTNQVNAADASEARQWEIMMEDLECPTLRELQDGN